MTRWEIICRITPDRIRLLRLLLRKKGIELNPSQASLFDNTNS